MVMPSAAAPRGMMDTRCTGSAVGDARATSACPISCTATISRSFSLMTRLLRSRPATTRSMASSSSVVATESFSRRAANSAASLITFARAAPVNPGVRDAITVRSTLGSRATPRACTLRMASHPPLADRVQLIEEHQRRGLLLRLVEQLPHPGRPEAHEHLDELRARHEEEGDVGLAGHGPGQQRLAAAGRAQQQDALGDAPSQTLVLLWVLEEVHDLAQLLDGLVEAGHVAERGLH